MNRPPTASASVWIVSLCAVLGACGSSDNPSSTASGGMSAGSSGAGTGNAGTLAGSSGTLAGSSGTLAGSSGTLAGSSGAMGGSNGTPGGGGNTAVAGALSSGGALARAGANAGGDSAVPMGGSAGVAAQAGSAGSPSSAGAPHTGGGTTGSSDPNNGANGAEKPTGFAAVNGMGLATTTGGSGGPVVTASTFEQLSAYLDSDDTMIILVQGSIDLTGSMVPMRSNKSLIGLAGARLHNGGIEMNRRQNIIVRNITFADGTDDTFKINQNTHHIWVDHCDFTKAADGLFDITRQSSYITISWNKFYEHSKTMLIGHSDAATDDTGFLKTTVHHNWFNGTEQRHPRVRFGEVHVYNNYFLANALYGVASTMEADVVVEGNFFESVPFPTQAGYAESAPGDIVERNNVYMGSGAPQTRGMAFDPSAAYSYVVENPASIPVLVKAKAGVGVIDPMAAAR